MCRNRAGTAAAVWLCCLLLVLVTPVRAADSDRAAGEVLFAERYADYASLRDTGLRFGTSSWTGASLALKDGELNVLSASHERTFLLLPESVFTDSYTIRFTFRFTELLEPNGCVGFILTSTGDAPANRTEVLFHANGSCGDFGQLSAPLAQALTRGDPVTVGIPVEHGMLHEITVTDGTTTDVLLLTNVRPIAPGGRGFSFRNASAALSSVEVVNGVSFGSLSGVYASSSYVAPDDFRMTAFVAPFTPDFAVPLLLNLPAAALGAAALLRRRKK